MKNIPNIISLFRLFSTPFIIWFILNNKMLTALILFIIAGISDVLDGFIARATNSHSFLGAYIDPIADKVLITSIYLLLGYKNLIPQWLIFPIIFRDIMIISGIAFSSIYKKRSLKIKPLFISKINTLLQIMLVIQILMFKALDITHINYTKVLSIIVLFTTITSGICYIKLWINFLYNKSTN